ncbi:MAG TPA: CBS domain-containing protein [Polyangiales bacterium]
MAQEIPPIRVFMTMAPVAVSRDQTLAYAQSLMKDHSVRHLPVVDANGSVVGVLSQRTMQLVARRWDLDDARLPVDALTNHDVYTVPPEAPIDAVCATMAEQRYGCAIVVHDKKPIGIFTTTDACAALAALARGPAA